jgi:hypothetical protein
MEASVPQALRFGGRMFSEGAAALARPPSRRPRHPSLPLTWPDFYDNLQDS